MTLRKNYLALLVAGAVVVVGMISVARGHNPHQDCTHSGNDITGTNGDDDCTGTESGGEAMKGLMGADWFRSEGGGDSVVGNEGLDELYGGAGNDKIDGNKNDDTVTDTTLYDTDYLCDGPGNDGIDMADNDGNDRWYNFPDGDAERYVRRDDNIFDGTDRIIDNSELCPQP
ncbi:MAG: hypothetical protein M3N53_12945 [Actinomycetota bacterium]|nr:hypothetical protein [Actinomycetota bacterium]